MADASPGRDGRAAEFDRVYAQHGREVWAVAYARWLDAHLAMDLTHEAFLRLWKAWEAGEEILSARAWLFRVVRNLAQDHGKSAFRRNGTQDPDELLALPGSDTEPGDALERAEVHRLLHRELEQLSEPDRELLTLRYALDYDTPRLAELLGITPTTLHMRLSRARQRLAQRLTEQGIGPPP